MSKIALVTGAGGNLGKSVVKKFVHDGYTVVATVSPGKKSDYSDPKIDVRELDLTDEQQCDLLIKSVVQKYKQIDAVLLLAGGFSMGSLKHTDAAAIQKMVNLNFNTAYNVARPAFDQMTTQSAGGKIVMIGSRPALIADAGKDMIAYSLSKSMIFKLAEFLNAEGAKKNIVTSVVVPSTIDTPENRKSMPGADFSSWVSPEAIAATIADLCSNSILREPIIKVYGNA